MVEYNSKSSKAMEFINDKEILDTISFAKKKLWQQKNDRRDIIKGKTDEWYFTQRSSTFVRV